MPPIVIVYGIMNVHERLLKALLFPEFSNIFLQPGNEVKGVSVTGTFFLYKCEIHLDYNDSINSTQA